MDYHLDDTIAAVASPPGIAARGLVRISGRQTIEAVSAVFDSDAELWCRRPACPMQSDTPERSGKQAGRLHHNLSELRFAQAISGTLRLDSPLGDVPCELFIWPTNRSYTQEPVAELHLSGSAVVLDAAVNQVCRGPVRLAQPGEFTMRAFLAGRLDLTQAEAVLGVIDASDDTQRDVALSQLAGGLSTPLGELRNDLLDLLAHLEAGLDFVEEDIEFISQEELRRHLSSAQNQLRDLAERLQHRDVAGVIYQVVLLGRPNVGKSSLWNALAGDGQKALVAEQSGTTRDYLQREIQWQGVRCRLVDTAGLDENHSPIDDAAQAMTRNQAKQADLEILCLDASREWDEWEKTQANAASPGRIVVLTKCDLATEGSPENLLATSSQTAQGIDELQDEIAARLTQQTPDGQAMVATTAVRCRESIVDASECLQRAETLTNNRSGEELIAAELRTALEHLGRVVGAVYTDDVLDRIFSRFCIGK